MRIAGYGLCCLWLLGGGLWGGCALLPQTASDPNQEQRPSQLQFRIPFQRYGDHLFVWVSVNGSSLQRFILDTGAAHTIMSQPLATALNLKPQDRFFIQGVGTDKISAAKVFNVGFSAAGVTWQGQEVWVASPTFFAPLTQYFGQSFQGVLGADLFRHYVVEIDYQAQYLNLYSPEQYRYMGTGHRLPLKLRKNKPYVEVEVKLAGQPIKAVLLVDVGSGSALSLRGALPPLAGQQPILSRVTVGVGGTKPIQVSRVAQLQLGKVVLKDLVANLEGRPYQRRMGGRLGNPILERFRVIFDYAHRQLILEPKDDLTRAFEYDMSGLLLKAKANSLIQVVRVYDASPAAQANVLANDEITAIDDQLTTDLTLPQIRALLRGPANRIRRLRLQRAGKRIEVDLKLRDLI